MTDVIQKDWTAGVEAICFDRCTRCGNVEYFPRPFCTVCGSAVRREKASGNGVLRAKTKVVRAPTKILQSAAPYTVCLVEAQEGFRLMGHLADDAEIGCAVKALFYQFDQHLTPLFARDE